VIASLLFRFLSSTQFLINEKMTREKISRYSSLFKGKLLDIGAGEKPYQKLFTQAESYTGTNTCRHYNFIHSSIKEGITDVWIEDGTALPFPDASFDGIVNFQVLSVISQPDKFFKEMHRVLQPEGMLMLTTDFLYPKWSPEDVMRHTDVHLRMLASNNGFEIVAMESYGGFQTMFYSLFIRYIRSYLAILKKKKYKLQQILFGLFYFFMLLGQPFYALWGFIIYGLEKNTRDMFDYTMDVMIICRKKNYEIKSK